MKIIDNRDEFKCPECNGNRFRLCDETNYACEGDDGNYGCGFRFTVNEMWKYMEHHVVSVYNGPEEFEDSMTKPGE